MAAVPPIDVVSSMQNIADSLQARQIDNAHQAGQLRFQVGEDTSLSEAVKIKARTEPGRHGFIVVNHELLACKNRAAVQLEAEFRAMVRASLARIDAELQPVEASLAALRVLELTPDAQMPHHGPPLIERGQGSQQCLYPQPIFPANFGFEHANGNQRVSYIHPYNTQELREQAAARDRRAQRALWTRKIRILQARQTILKEQKTEMVLRMNEEYNLMMDEQSDVGCGYADFTFAPLV